MSSKRKRINRSKPKLEDRELDAVKTLKREEMEKAKGSGSARIKVGLTNNSGVDNQVG